MMPSRSDNNPLGFSPSRREDGKDDVNNNNNNYNIPIIIIYIDSAENKALIKAKDRRTGQILHSGTDAVDTIQRALNTLAPATGGVLSISDGYYAVASNNIIIPHINNLTIQGNSPMGNTVFDARNIHTPNLSDPRYVGVFSRSTEDPRNDQSLHQINNLTIRNMRIIGNQTGAGYLDDKLAIDGLRINNVNNLLVENICTNSLGLSIECRNIDRAVIRNCQSFNDAAGPTLSNNSKNVIIENCYTFGSYDDSFACLGNIPTTTAITFKNCIADKGLNAPPSVTASCFKLDSGGTEFKIGLPGYIFLLVLDILKRGVIMVTYFSVNILIIIVYVRVIVSHGRP